MFPFAEGRQVKAYITPVQPETLPSAVRRILDDMHRDPGRAHEIIKQWRKNNQEKNFAGARFEGLNLKGAPLNGLGLDGASFFRCTLPHAKFSSSTLTGAEFRQIEGSKGVEFKFAQSLDDANFHGCAMPSASFEAVSLNRASFTRCVLRGANFTRAQLAYATFRAVEFDSSTVFFTPQRIEGCSVEQYALACLGPGYGGLTEGNRMDMRIVDHVADLRLKFSGFWAWVHLLSVVAFFFPYGWFVFVQWGRARFADPPVGITMLEALGRYIVNGGREWQEKWNPELWACFMFGFVCLYQVCRLVLLGKTKALEARQTVTGLPAKFSLDEPNRFGFKWRWMLQFVRFALWAMIVVAIVNTLNFLLMRVPGTQ